MTGEYQEADEILVPLVLENEIGEILEIEAVRDTGFGGDLMLTQEVVQELALPQADIGTARLADGSVVRLAVHEVVVNWNEEKRLVLAYVGDGNCLLGMALLRGSVGMCEFFPGGFSTIEPRE